MTFYLNGHASHSDSLHSFNAENKSSVGDNLSQHMGWEILMGGTDLQQGIELQVSGTRYDMSKTQCLIYNGNEEHHEYFNHQNKIIKALVIPDEIINERLDGVAKAADFSFKSKVSEDSVLIGFAKSAFSYLRSSSFEVNEIRSIADSLLLEIIDNQDHNKASIKKELIGESLNRLLFKDILVQIHAHAFSPDFNLDDISQHLGVSKFHIIRTAKKLGGFTPHAYLLKIRLREAQRLLKESAASIGSVAAACGFEELSTFNKAFLRQFGSSPSKYRVS